MKSNTCEICGRSFKNPQAVRGHKNLTHGLTKDKIAEFSQSQPSIHQSSEQTDYQGQSQLIAIKEYIDVKAQPLLDKVESLSEQVGVLTGKVGTIEKRFGELNVKVDQFNNDTKRRVDQLSSTVSALARSVSVVQNFANGLIGNINSFERRLDYLNSRAVLKWEILLPLVQELRICDGSVKAKDHGLASRGDIPTALDLNQKGNLKDFFYRGMNNEYILAINKEGAKKVLLLQK